MIEPTMDTAVDQDIIEFHILNRLDAHSLASAASASSHMRRLCTENHLWRNICADTWPSLSHPVAASLIATFPAAHRAIFSDAFPSLNHSPRNPRITQPPPPELISAVDLYYKAKPVFSRVIQTETQKGWFLNSPLWVELLDSNTPMQLQGSQDQCLNHLQENLTLSWIIMDPSLKRAANLSSRRPLSAYRHCLSGDLHLLYALPMETVQCVIKVTCFGKLGGPMHVRQVTLSIEDTHGKLLMGRDTLLILQDALIHGQRKKFDPHQLLQSFHNFSTLKTHIRERKATRDTAIDLFAMLLAFTLFLFLFLFCFMPFSV
ncbi:hypothetical protein VNO78_14008 [Psophocarpus tetragonolobus]|uniref:F-box domain-containing protein n=1 Tax=Psophocarpus tetragonolobus TaxID=3891 RepID=A0AAN9SYC7_PSOTE